MRDTLSEPDLLEGYRQHYHDGAVCETKIYHGGTTIVFSIPASSLTPQQALVLFRPLWLRQSPDPIQTKEVPGGIFVSGDGGYGYLSITSKEGRVLVELGAAD